MLDAAPGAILRGKTYLKGVAEGKLVETANSFASEQFFTKYLPKVTRSALKTAVAESTIEAILKDADSMTDVEIEGCLNLIECSSKMDYANSELKWKPIAKKKEMRLRDMKYIMLQDRRLVGTVQASDMDISGFVSFMVTYEDGLEVVYIYEVHLDPRLQGKGVGTLLMKAVEAIGQEIGLSKSMLTVFKSNEKAEQWYRHLGYATDQYSPSSKRLRNGVIKEPSYLILSKLLK